MFPEHVERRFLDPEYSFDEYFQLGSRRKVGPVKNGLKNTNFIQGYDIRVHPNYGSEGVIMAQAYPLLIGLSRSCFLPQPNPEQSYTLRGKPCMSVVIYY